MSHSLYLFKVMISSVLSDIRLVLYLSVRCQCPIVLAKKKNILLHGYIISNPYS